MPPRKKLIITSKIVVAGRQRKCYHSQSHNIVKGDSCLEVKAGQAKKGYCTSCALAMLADAEQEIRRLRAGLGDHSRIG